MGDATMLITSGALPIKLHEVAPFVTILDMGPATGGGVAFNKDVWETLPEDVQTALRELGQNYTVALQKEVARRRENAIKVMTDAGATLYYPTDEQKGEWVAALPDIAGTWREAQEARGVPAKQAIDEFMSELRAQGVTPLRDWTSE